jgi:DNA-binding NarL/FixJ family response regulator
MKNHLFITRREIPLPSWREAFPAAKIRRYEAIDTKLALPGEALLWLHVDNHVKEPAIQVDTLRKTTPGCSIVVLSNITRDDEGLAVLEAGAAGYTGALAVADALRQVEAVVNNGGLWVGPDLMRRLLLGLNRGSVRPQATALLEQLSPREREVALAVAAGATNKEIAQKLDITERTVKAHLGRAFEILNIRDRLQLAINLNGHPT